ncbi:transcriptional regulator domain-containing protein [Sphingomonas oryzagri]
MIGERRKNGAVRRNLDFAGFAQEFLRRNPDYRQDYQAITRNAGRSALTVEQEVMARRWGLCFSLRPGCASRERACALAAIGIARDRHSRRCSARHCRRTALRHRRLAHHPC